jgi:hypothetical protein
LGLHPRVIRLDAGYWGLKLIAWIHTVLGARAVIPWNPKRQKQRDGLPPTWTAEELGKRTSIERFFGRVLIFFRLQRPPLFGWSAMQTCVALTDAAVWVSALAAWQAGRPDLIRSPRLVLAHVWEGVEARLALDDVSHLHACPDVRQNQVLSRKRRLRSRG